MLDTLIKKYEAWKISRMKFQVGDVIETETQDHRWYIWKQTSKNYWLKYCYADGSLSNDEHFTLSAGYVKEAFSKAYVPPPKHSRCIN